jgi:hypothetical protein
MSAGIEIPLSTFAFVTSTLCAASKLFDKQSGNRRIRDNATNIFHLRNPFAAVTT